MPPPNSRSAFPRFAAICSIALLTALTLMALVRGCTGHAPTVAATTGPGPTPPAAVPAAPNAVPAAAAPEGYRMRALTFAMDASGVRLEQAAEAPGRVKAPPLSIAPYRLEFEVYGRDGEKLYAGSLDHPLHRIDEYEDPSRPGTLRHVAREVASDAFQIRLPATLPGVRVAFFEVRPAADSSVRTALGSVPLP